MPSWLTTSDEPHTLDSLEPIFIIVVTMRGYTTWWVTVRPSPLGIDEEEDADVDMTTAPSKESFDEDE